MQTGIQGLQQVTTFLRDYYANDDTKRADAGMGGHAEGRSGHNSVGGAIISALEDVLTDFSKTFAEMEAAESTAAREYEETSQENTISKATKENTLKYKAKE